MHRFWSTWSWVCNFVFTGVQADRCLSTWLPALPSFIKSCGVTIMKSDKIWQKYVNILYEGHYVHDVTHLLLSLTLTTHFYHVHRNMIYLPNLHDEGKGRKVRAAAHCVVFIRVRNPTALFWPMHRLSLFSSLSLLSLFFAVAFVFPVHTSHYSRFRYFLRNQEKSGLDTLRVICGWMDRCTNVRFCLMLHLLMLDGEVDRLGEVGVVYCW